MTTHDRDAFLEELERELGLSPGDAAEGLLALASDGTAPGGDARQRLLGSLATTHRFDDLAALIAEETALDADAVDALLLSIDASGPDDASASAWSPGPLPHIELLHFEGGPGRERSITGFVRVAPGEAFPPHDHLGEEVVVVLQGAFEDTATGIVHGRGARVTATPGVEHAVRVAQVSVLRVPRVVDIRRRRRGAGAHRGRSRLVCGRGSLQGAGYVRSDRRARGTCMCTGQRTRITTFPRARPVSQ